MSLLVHGFPAELGAEPRSLVLGSMPGRASLLAGRYYAHPRNAFWPIMAALLGFSMDAPYPDRLACLQANGIGLWDVMAACERAGSLDADIVPASVRANDFAALFAVHRHIGRIFFNGAEAEKAFRRHVLPGLSASVPELYRLPSTSPAHAAMSFADKLAAWSVILTK